jgi:hypothetical protein
MAKKPAKKKKKPKIGAIINVKLQVLLTTTESLATTAQVEAEAVSAMTIIMNDPNSPAVLTSYGFKFVSVTA